MDIGILHIRVPLRSAYVASGFGALIGLAYAFYLFPVDFFVGHGAFWQAPPIEDIATEITALRYYVDDRWQFPLFRTVGIAPPRGMLVFLDPRYAAAFAAGHDDYRQLCRAFDKGIACSKIWSDIEQSGLGGIFTPI